MEHKVRPYRIVVAGHGAFPAALIETAEMICGQIPDAIAVGLGPSETPDRFAERLRPAIGQGAEASPQDVLVLCDLLGGTPYNVAAAVARRSRRVICLSGANLPMLVEAALSRDRLGDPLIERLLEAGRSGIAETERDRARRAS